MKKLLLIALLVTPSVAFAQAPAVPSAVSPTEYVLKVKPADVDKIGKGLGFLPFNDVAELMQTLREQVIEQQKPKSEPKKDK